MGGEVREDKDVLALREHMKNVNTKIRAQEEGVPDSQLQVLDCMENDLEEGRSFSSNNADGPEQG